MNTEWHFLFMVLVSLLVFWLMMRLILPREEFRARQPLVALLALVVVVFGMVFGKYGATLGLPW